MNYTLKHMDQNLAVFSIKTKSVDQCVILKKMEPFLPLPLKRIIKDGYKEEFVEKETEEYFILNEDGCYLFDNWLSDRQVPINRFNYELYISANSSPREWLLNNNGYSFNDCYWFEKEGEDLYWENIKDRLNSLDVFYMVQDDNHKYKGQNATLGGQLEKFWFKENNKVMLCKKHPVNLDILAAREVFASLIYEKQGFENYCPYKFTYRKNNSVAGVVCECFTNEQTELVTAYDLLEEYNMTQYLKIREKIVELAQNYGMSPLQTQRQLDIETLVDFLITNRDRHENNIAFLRNVNSLQIIGMAPIFDNGSSQYMEGQLPEGLLNTTVNSLYPTELECLEKVTDFMVLDIEKLPTIDEFNSILLKCNNITENRKNNLLSIYQNKVDLIKELQKEYQKGTNVSEYLQKKKDEKTNEILFNE